MIKIICDRCGAEMKESDNIGYIIMDIKAGLAGSQIREITLENTHYCAGCMDKIYKFIMPEPEREAAEPEPEPMAEPEPEPMAGPEPEPMAGPEPMAEPEPEPEAAPGTPKAPKKRREIDTGKIMALKNAGWTTKEIADEMRMKPNDISNVIYRYKKKKAGQDKTA